MESSLNWWVESSRGIYYVDVCSTISKYIMVYLFMTTIRVLQIVWRFLYFTRNIRLIDWHGCWLTLTRSGKLCIAFVAWDSSINSAVMFVTCVCFVIFCAKFFTKIKVFWHRTEQVRSWLLWCFRGRIYSFQEFVDAHCACKKNLQANPAWKMFWPTTSMTLTTSDKMDSSSDMGITNRVALGDNNIIPCHRDTTSFQIFLDNAAKTDMT